MSDTQVTVHIGFTSIEVNVKESHTVQDLLSDMITRLDLPRTKPDGSPMFYALDHKESGARLPIKENILETGVNSGDHLVLFSPRKMSIARWLTTFPLLFVLVVLFAVGGYFLRSTLGVWQTSLLFVCGAICFHWAAVSFSSDFASSSQYGFTKSLRDAIPDLSNVFVSTSMAFVIAAIVLWLF